MPIKHETKLIHELQNNGRLSNVDLAKKIGLSESPCLRKTKALEESGVIQGYKAVINPRKVGCQITAIILVNLEQSEKKTAGFFEEVLKEKRVIDCLAITGSADLLLKVVAKDIDDLSEFTLNGLLRNPYVKDISSCVVLKEIKRDSEIPVFEL